MDIQSALVNSHGNRKIREVSLIISLTTKCMTTFNFINLKIDDNKEIFDLSDHNLLTATFYKNNGHEKKFAKKKCKEIISS